MSTIIHKELSYIITGILYDAHNKVGRFASEKQICDLIEYGLKQKPLPYVREFILPSAQAGEKIGRHRVDFLVDNKIVLEIKYRTYLKKEDYEQIRRYLAELNLALGILVNFRDERLHPKRILNGGGKE